MSALHLLLIICIMCYMQPRGPLVCLVSNLYNISNNYCYFYQYTDRVINQHAVHNVSRPIVKNILNSSNDAHQVHILLTYK